MSWNPSEKGFQQAVTDLAKLRGWTVYHPFHSQRSTAGWPDLTLIRPPEIVFAELKTLTGRVTPQQRAFLAQLTACGLEVYVWRPSDMDEIRRRLGRPAARPPAIPGSSERPVGRVSGPGLKPSPQDAR